MAENKDILKELREIKAVLGYLLSLTAVLMNKQADSYEHVDVETKERLKRIANGAQAYLTTLKYDFKGEEKDVVKQGS